MEISVTSLLSLRGALESLPPGGNLVIDLNESPPLRMIVPSLRDTFDHSEEGDRTIKLLGYRPEKSYYAIILAKYLSTH